MADMIEESIRSMAQSVFPPASSNRPDVSLARSVSITSSVTCGSVRSTACTSPTRSTPWLRHDASSTPSHASPRSRQDVRRAGAFYEVVDRLPVTLTAYLSGNLPPSDRRDPAVPDRRTPFREGAGSGTGSCSPRSTRRRISLHRRWGAQTSPGSIHPRCRPPSARPPPGRGFRCRHRHSG